MWKCQSWLSLILIFRHKVHETLRTRHAQNTLMLSLMLPVKICHEVLWKSLLSFKELATDNLCNKKKTCLITINLVFKLFVYSQVHSLLILACQVKLDDMFSNISNVAVIKLDNNPISVIGCSFWSGVIPTGIIRIHVP